MSPCLSLATKQRGTRNKRKEMDHRKNTTQRNDHRQRMKKIVKSYLIVCRVFQNRNAEVARQWWPSILHTRGVSYVEKVMLYFDLRLGQKCHSKVMHRKEVTHSNGSYEKKSRGRKLADEMGRGKKFPWHTHRLMHRKRVTCELHDSYFCLMTIQHAIPKIE